MSPSLRVANRIIQSDHRFLNIFFLIFPMGMLVIKGWVNTLTLLLFLFSSWKIVKKGGDYFRKRPRYFWITFASLLAPLVCEITAQLLRGAFVPSSLDGPSRFFAAAIIYVWLSRFENTNDLTKNFAIGSLCGALIASISILFLTDHHWGARAATYFIDPNSLGIYLSVLITIGWFVRFEDNENTNFRLLLKWLAIIIGLYCMIKTGTRTAWIAMSIVALLSAASLPNISFRRKFMGIVMLVISFILIFAISDTVQKRAKLLHTNIQSVLSDKHKDNSVSIRYAIFKIDLNLISHNPFGVKDGNIPSLDELRGSDVNVSKRAWKTRRVAGSHSEILAQLVRKGPALGTITIFFLLLYPIITFFKFRNNVRDFDTARALPLVTILLLICSVGSEIFNLKMNSSFWGVFLALFYVTVMKLNKHAN